MIRKEFDDALKSVENSVQKGKKGDRWFPHSSLEGGTDTLAYGHKLTNVERKSGMVKIGNEFINLKDGLTEDHAEALFQQDKGRHEKGLQQAWPGYDNLPAKYKEVLVNIAFNAGTPSPTTWPKLYKSMQAGDDAAVRKQMVTHYQDPNKGWTALDTRAQHIADAAGLSTEEFVGKLYAAAMRKPDVAAKYMDKVDYQDPKNYGDFKPIELKGNTFAERYKSFRDQVGIASLPLETLSPAGTAVGMADLAASIKRRDTTPWDVVGAIPAAGPAAHLIERGWRLFNNRTLHMLTSNIANGLGEGTSIVNMSPDDYLKMAYQMPRNKEGLLHSMDQRNVDDLVRNWDPQKSDVPYLEIADDGQVLEHNGRHRALAAMELGAESIPVRVIRRSGTDKTPRVMQEQIDDFEEWMANNPKRAPHMIPFPEAQDATSFADYLDQISRQ